MDEDIVDQALSLERGDFEDALQYYASKKFDVDFIVTRNTSDYRKFDVNVLNPKQAVALLHKV